MTEPVTMIAIGLFVTGYVIYTVNSARRRLRNVMSIYDRRDAAVVRLLERMAENGDLDVARK